MKQTIAWHENCIKNQRTSFEELNRQLGELKKKYEYDLKKLIFYELQIKEAKKFGKDGFDSEKFMMKRKGQG